MTPSFRVLVLCTGNSARSQLAEALLRLLSHGVVEVHSAGTRPRPEVHPMAKASLARLFHLETSNLFPKSLDRFLGTPFDFVITVCDNAAEACPVFPGAAERIHWSLPDPAEATGSPDERQQVFDRTAIEIADRLRAWLASPAVRQKLEPDGSA